MIQMHILALHSNVSVVRVLAIILLCLTGDYSLTDESVGQVGFELNVICMDILWYMYDILRYCVICS